MSIAVTVQERGRVTLPVEARRDLGIGPGDRVAWVRNRHGLWEVCPLDQLASHVVKVRDDFLRWTRRGGTS